MIIVGIIYIYIVFACLMQVVFWLKCVNMTTFYIIHPLMWQLPSFLVIAAWCFWWLWSEAEVCRSSSSGNGYVRCNGVAKMWVFLCGFGHDYGFVLVKYLMLSLWLCVGEFVFEKHIWREREREREREE